MTICILLEGKNNRKGKTLMKLGDTLNNTIHKFNIVSEYPTNKEAMNKLLEKYDIIIFNCNLYSILEKEYLEKNMNLVGVSSLLEEKLSWLEIIQCSAFLVYYGTKDNEFLDKLYTITGMISDVSRCKVSPDCNDWVDGLVLELLGESGDRV